jgi:hypothetical protein
MYKLSAMQTGRGPSCFDDGMPCSFPLQRPMRRPQKLLKSLEFRSLKKCSGGPTTCPKNPTYYTRGTQVSICSRGKMIEAHVQGCAEECRDDPSVSGHEVGSLREEGAPNRPISMCSARLLREGNKRRYSCKSLYVCPLAQDIAMDKAVEDVVNCLPRAVSEFIRAKKERLQTDQKVLKEVSVL